MSLKKMILNNGMKILYEKVPGDITSFTIGFEAGANVENKEELGLAHAVEHMVFKGTKNYDEKEINDLCNKYFGFHNAMTNYPYVVYYGSSLKEEFKPAFQLYFDVVFNPTFKDEGFKEEISVILEELKEWGDDVVQHCEDKLFYNSFENRRIKELIIGKEETIKAFTIDDLKAFHKKFYVPSNCVISVVSSLEEEEVLKIIKEEIKHLNFKNTAIDYVEERANKNKGLIYENPKEGIFKEKNSNISGCKMQYIFPIHELSEREITMLHLFNEYFASGTSSLLYDEIRTKRGLVYDIQGRVKSEKGIKIYTLTLSTSKENIEEVRTIISDAINKVKNSNQIFNEQFLKKHMKSQRIKRMLSLEKSIVMSMNLVVYEIMHSGGELLLNEFVALDNHSEDEMKSMIKKVLKNETIGIIEN